MPDVTENQRWYTLSCNQGDGIRGSIIKIVSKVQDKLAFCGVRVYGVQGEVSVLGTVPRQGAAIEVDSQGHLYVLNTYGVVYKQGSNNSWLEFAEDTADLAVGPNDEIWRIAKSTSDTYQFLSGSWSPVGGDQVSYRVIAGSSEVWRITNANAVNEYQASSPNKWRAIGVQATDMSLGKHNSQYFITDTEKAPSLGSEVKIRFETQSTEFLTPPNPVKIISNHRHQPLIIDVNGSTFRYDGNDWIHLDDDAIDFATSPNSRGLWKLNAYG